MLGRQPIQRLPEFLRRLGGQDRFPGGPARIGGAFLGVGVVGFAGAVERHTPPAATSRCRGAVDDAAQEPRAEGSGLIELRDPLVRADKRRLDDIFSERHVAGHQVGCAERPDLIGAHQRFESADVSALELG